MKKTYVYAITDPLMTNGLAKRGWQIDTQSLTVFKDFEMDPYANILKQYRDIFSKMAMNSEEIKKEFEDAGFEFAIDWTENPNEPKLALVDNEKFLTWRAEFSMGENPAILGISFAPSAIDSMTNMFCDAEVIDKYAPEIAFDMKKAGIKKVDVDKFPNVVSQFEKDVEEAKKQFEQESKRLEKERHKA